MREMIQVEYRCARHESPVADCTGCDVIREMQAFSDKLHAARVKLVTKIKEQLQKKEIVVVEMR